MYFEIILKWFSDRPHLAKLLFSYQKKRMTNVGVKSLFIVNILLKY